MIEKQRAWRAKKRRDYLTWLDREGLKEPSHLPKPMKVREVSEAAKASYVDYCNHSRDREHLTSVRRMLDAHTMKGD